MSKQLIYVGGYASPEMEGIQLFNLDLTSGQLTYVKGVPESKWILPCQIILILAQLHHYEETRSSLLMKVLIAEKFTSLMEPYLSLKN